MGALICTPEIFSKVYLLEKKRIKRRRNTSLLIKVKLAELNNEFLVNQFIEKLRSKLRAGDVIAKEKEDVIYILISEIAINDFFIIVRRIINLAAATEFEIDIEVDWEEISINNCAKTSKILCKL